jgi:hypothetical protein
VIVLPSAIVIAPLESELANSTLALSLIVSPSLTAANASCNVK